MIISFGATLMHFAIQSDAPPNDSVYPETMRAASAYNASIGGKAALQALAAAHAGAKIALVSKIGDDHYGKNALLKLRQRGVVTSGVGRNNTVPTGSCFNISGKTRDRIIALGASGWIENTQIPDEILKPDTILMVQTETNIQQTAKLMERAKEQDSRVILNLSPNTDIPPEMMKNADFLIVPEVFKGYVADARKYDELVMIVLSKDGSVSVSKGSDNLFGQPKPEHDLINWNHPTASEDTFVGTFAAGLYAKMQLQKSVGLANTARALSASNKGSHKSLPYLDTVKDVYSEAEG